MIINIRGTHGSGKSTLARELIEAGEEASEMKHGKKILGYWVRFAGIKKPVYFVGNYTNACGGADGIQPYKNILPRVLKAAKYGHVFFEGALVSSCHGAIIDALAERRDVVIGFLDTPLNVCLKRIADRRAAKGNLTPLNPKNTISKYEVCVKSRDSLKLRGFDVREINYKQAEKDVMKILKGAK